MMAGLQAMRWLAPPVCRLLALPLADVSSPQLQAPALALAPARCSFPIWRPWHRLTSPICSFPICRHWRRLALPVSRVCLAFPGGELGNGYRLGAALPVCPPPVGRLGRRLTRPIRSLPVSNFLVRLTPPISRPTDLDFDSHRWHRNWRRDGMLNAHERQGEQARQQSDSLAAHSSKESRRSISKPVRCSKCLPVCARVVHIGVLI